MHKFVKATALSAVLLPINALAYDDAAIIKQCDEEWGSDFAMIKYCREQQRTAGRAYENFKAQAETSEAAATILDHCESEWRKDYSMVVYCIEQQSSALQSLSASPDDIPPEVQEKIKSQCSAEWGTDFSMIAYCVEQQTNAWRSLQ